MPKTKKPDPPKPPAKKAKSEPLVENAKPPSAKVSVAKVKPAPRKGVRPVDAVKNRKPHALATQPSVSVETFHGRTFDPSHIPDDGFYSFRDELTTYRDNLDELLEHEGQHVVIKGTEIIGLYDDEQQALVEAAKRFGEEPVLVKQVVATEPVAVINHAAV